LTAPLLAEAIFSAVSDSSLREKAAATGINIRAEGGVGQAVRVVEAYFNPDNSG